MATKRSHSKSRTGCKQCKARRIKCDETPPYCLNCSKKNLTCEYQDFRDAFENIRLLTPATFKTQPSQPAAPSQSQFHGTGSARTTLSPEPSWPERRGSFTLADLGYLHYYTMHTYSTLSVIPSPTAQQRWQSEVPRLALSHPFLMHALLSVGAAHQTAMLPPHARAAADMHAARTHYSAALTLFLDNVTDVDGERADALLCFSILVSQTTLYLESEGSEADAISNFVSLLHVLHGATGVLSECQGALRKSEIGKGLLGHVWAAQDGRAQSASPPGHDGEFELACALEQLEVVAERYVQQQQQHQQQYQQGSPDSMEMSSELPVLRNAITRLRLFFTMVSTRPSSWVYFLTWPIGLSPEFAVLLQRRHPVALCVTAHWCVPLWHAPEKWYAGNWPKRLMVDIRGELAGTEWEDGIAWPLRETMGAEVAMM